MLYTIILKDGTLYHITSEHFEKYSKYTWLDLHQEFSKMERWCEDNPRNRKTEKGIKKFMTCWLNRARPVSKTTTRDRTLIQDLTDRSWAQ